MAIEYFIRGSDNQIKLTLTEDGMSVAGAWTVLDVYIGSRRIHRDNDEDGVSLDTSTGILTITPGDLTLEEQNDIQLLTPDRLYRAKIVVKTALNDDGAVFGGEGCRDPLYFHISDKTWPESGISPI